MHHDYDADHMAQPVRTHMVSIMTYAPQAGCSISAIPAGTTLLGRHVCAPAVTLAMPESRRA